MPSRPSLASLLLGSALVLSSSSALAELAQPTDAAPSLALTASAPFEASSPRAVTSGVEASSPARARRAKRIAAPELPPGAGIALSTGLPLRFFNGEGAGSFSYGFAHHFAVRANVASYKAWDVENSSEYRFTGRNTDVGLGLVWYPRRLWSGLTLELGGLVRGRDVQLTDHFARSDRYLVATDTSIYAARGLVGWTWSWQPFFVSLSVGLSAGVERGTETSSDEMEEQVVARPVNRRITEGETSFRVGFAFGG